MKIIKKIMLLTVLILLTGCSSCRGKGSSINEVNIGLDGAVGFRPIPGIKPSDAEDIHRYRISINNLEDNSIYAIASNQLIYHGRDVAMRFFNNDTENEDTEVTFNKNNKITNNLNNQKKELINFIPDFDYPSLETLDKSGLTKSIETKKAVYQLGDTKEKYIYLGGTSLQNLNFTLRSKSHNHNRTLNIWVADDNWTSQNEPNKINQDTINEIAQMFLERDKSIYPLVTNIYGKEYYDTTPPYRDLIESNKEIDIIIANLNRSYTGGRLLGYFNPADAFNKEFQSHSNEIIGFYLDAQSLVDKDDSWRDFAYSTIGHEFLHLIVFYQHYLLRGGRMARWLNEMLALATEDILSNYLNLMGPRGIDGQDLSEGDSKIKDGRIPQANEKNSLSTYASSINDYSMSSSRSYSINYSYGAYLLRNFATNNSGIDRDSLTFFRDIVFSGRNDFDAIVYAMNNYEKKYNYPFSPKTSFNLENSFINWGRAIILSQNKENNSYFHRFNNGEDGFLASINDVKYKIGSINFFNYSPKPYIYKVNEIPPKLDKASILLFELAENYTGDFSVYLELPNYTRVQLMLLDKDGRYTPIKNGQLNIEKID